MKTILIPILQGSEAKNILRNDIFQVLRSQPQLRIVLLVPTVEKKEYFEAEFSGENIVYAVTSQLQFSFFDRIFFFLKKNLIRTSTLDIKRSNDLKADRNYPKYLLELSINRIFARKFFRKAVRWIDQSLIPDDRSVKIFDTYSPNLVFAAHIFGDAEASLLKEAKKRGVKTVGLINSWDKITSRGMVRILPDKLLVHNKIIRKEAMGFLDMRDDAVSVVGVPHYDIFVHPQVTPKEIFYQALGLQLNEKILLVCPMGKAFSDIDGELINVITNLMLEKLIPDDLRMLVRYPPNDRVDQEGIVHPETIIFDQPGVRFSSERGIDWDMNKRDMQRLIDSLYYCSMLICPPSSLSVDAAVFDKPIINIRFEKYDASAKNVNSYFEMDHYKHVIATGGVKLVRNEKELCEWINLYYKEPGIDRAGRKMIVEEQCGPLDGRAGLRVANILLSCLEKPDTAAW